MKWSCFKKEFGFPSCFYNYQNFSFLTVIMFPTENNIKKLPFPFCNLRLKWKVKLKVSIFRIFKWLISYRRQLTVFKNCLKKYMKKHDFLNHFSKNTLNCHNLNEFKSICIMAICKYLSNYISTNKKKSHLKNAIKRNIFL